jgi:hypothetical protein
MPPVSSRWSKSVSCPRRFLPTRSPIVTTFRGSAEIDAVTNCLREMLAFPATFFYPHSQSPREIGRSPGRFPLLIYPMLDDRTGSSRPVPPPIGEFVWTAE